LDDAKLRSIVITPCSVWIRFRSLESASGGIPGKHIVVDSYSVASCERFRRSRGCENAQAGRPGA
jgi:hypothetical protein